MIAVESIRLRRIEERHHLVVGFSSSILIHLILFGLWFVLGLFTLAMHRRVLEDLQQRQQEAAQQEPLIFVEVFPEQTTPAPPPEAAYYSTANAQAANPEPEIDSNVPKIVGSQDKVPKTEDTPPAEVLQPSLPPPEPEEVLPPKAVGPEPVGDMALVDPTPKPSRPRTLAEARRRRGLLAGPAMNQRGGVRRRGYVSLDVKASPFGAYDAAVIAAIQKRWYDLLDESAYITRAGKVVVEFRLHYDGRITDLRVTEQDVGEVLSLYCRKAISDPAPYAPWPGDMRRMMGKDYRDVKFTFYYL